MKAATRCGTAGVLAALSCTLACCLPALLAVFGGSAGAIGMAGMGESHGGLLHLLHRVSPALLLVSIVLVAAAFALRRPLSAIPALLAGVVLYASVHGQADPLVMYAGMVVGYGSWVALYLRTRPRADGPACMATTEAGRR